MGTTTEIDAGDQGREYVHARLSSGLSLSRLALGILDLQAGRVSAIAPPGHPDPWTFATGVPEPSSAIAVDVVVRLIRSDFECNGIGALWVEDPIARRSDPFWTNGALGGQPPGWFFNEEVYSVAFPSDTDDRLRAAVANIWEYPGWGGAAFVSGSGASANYQYVHEIKQSSLTAVATETRLIVCGAYDGQGFLVWRAGRPMASSA